MPILLNFLKKFKYFNKVNPHKQAQNIIQKNRNIEQMFSEPKCHVEQYLNNHNTYMMEYSNSIVVKEYWANHYKNIRG